MSNGVWNYMVCDTATGKITFSTTRGTLFNIVSPTNLNTPLTIDSSLINGNYFYKVDGTTDTLLNVATGGSFSYVLRVAISTDPNTFTKTFKMTERVTGVTKSISGTVTYNTQFRLNLWNTGSYTYSSVSANTTGSTVAGNYLPTYTYRDTNGDIWAWADDTTNTSNTSKYLALKMSNGVWNYMVCDTATGKITFSTTQGTLFNIVSSTNLNNPLTIDSSLIYGNYFYKVDGTTDKYLNIAKNYLRYVLRVASRTDPNTFTITFKMTEYVTGGTNKSISGTVTYNTPFNLNLSNNDGTYSMINSGYNDPRNGNYLPNYVYQGTTSFRQWTWADDGTNTSNTAKYLAFRRTLVWNYMVCDTATGVITFSTTRGTLFNIVSPTNLNTSLTIDSSLINNDYYFKVAGTTDILLSISNNDPRNALKVTSSRTDPNNFSITFKMV